MNNIEKVELFLNDNKNTTLILPKISGEVDIFYQMLIRRISKRKNLRLKKIEIFKNMDEAIAPSLFGDKYIYIIDTNITKNTFEELVKIKDNSLKFFLFLSYASYKTNPLNSIQLNAYDYKKDLSYFVQQDQDFQSLTNKIKTDFLNFSYENPHLFFSELEKSNVHTLSFDQVKDYDNDTILSIRREIFKYKNEFSIKILPKLYGLFKREVKIKKFNF